MLKMLKAVRSLMKTRRINRFSFSLSGLLVLLFCVFTACNKKVYKPTIIQGVPSAIAGDLKEDPNIKAMIEPYRQKLSGEMNRVIGYSEAEISKKPEFNQPLGNWVADIMMEVAKEKGLEADFGLVGMGGLRINLPKGPIKVSDIYELMPFENEIVVLETDDPSNRYLSLILGVKQTFGLSREAKWWYKNKGYDRAVIGMDEIDFTKPYHIVTTDYLANGGDNLETFKYLTVRKPTGVKLRDAIIKHIEKLNAENQKIVAPKEERFTDFRN